MLANLSSRPLYAKSSDAGFFTPPPEWDKLVRHARAGFNICLKGKAGSGKTTTLHQLSKHVDRATYIDASAVPDARQLIERVRSEVTGAPAALAESARQIGYAADAAFRAAPPGSRGPYLVDVLRSLVCDERRRLLLDATASTTAAFSLFGALRDELWQLDLQWIVAIDSDEEGLLLKPPASSFFDVVLSLDMWTEELLSDLLVRRATELPPAAIEDIAHVSNGSPRAALALARRFLVESPEAMNSQFRRQEAAARIGRSASMALAELEQLRDASASDERLLTRLGWSRERATQVLGELERQRVVTSRLVRQARGRPRKVYAPNEMF